MIRRRIKLKMLGITCHDTIHLPGISFRPLNVSSQMIEVEGLPVASGNKLFLINIPAFVGSPQCLPLPPVCRAISQPRVSALCFQRGMHNFMSSLHTVLTSLTSGLSSYIFPRNIASLRNTPSCQTHLLAPVSRQVVDLPNKAQLTGFPYLTRP